MHKNEETIRRFYTAFQKLDYAKMQDCYSENAIFNDPVFGLLPADELKAMWNMICLNAREFSLQFSNINLLDEEYATCDWTANYLFSRTGRRITNHIKAYMRFSDGKITEHSDAFKLSKWSEQAFGWKGWLFGWMGFMKRKIRKNARKMLLEFMHKETS